MSKPPTREEVELVKAEARRLGWLRSRLLGQPWPREGCTACGRPTCEVCAEASMGTESVEDEDVEATS